jgi:hypothetical protein
MQSIAKEMKQMLEAIWKRPGVASAVRIVKWKLDAGQLTATKGRLRR